MMSSWINPRFGGLVLPALSSFLDVEVHVPFHRHVAEVCSYVAGKALDDWGGDGGDPAVERVFHFSWNPFFAEGGLAPLSADGRDDDAPHSILHGTSSERLRLVDGNRGLVGNRALLTGCIHRSDQIVISFPAAHAAIDVGGGGYAGGNPLVNAV